MELYWRNLATHEESNNMVIHRISWNDKDPKYDIREWSPDHAKMGKGVTLTAEELKKLKDLLNGMNI